MCSARRVAFPTISSHMSRLCCFYRPSLRTAAHCDLPQSTNKSAGQVDYLLCHRTWDLVSRKSPWLASSTRLTLSSTAAAAIARTVLSNFASKNPTCESFGLAPRCRRLITQQGISSQLPFGPRELPRPFILISYPLTAFRSFSQTPLTQIPASNRTSA